MILNPNSWYVRWHFASLRIMDVFADRAWWDYDDGTRHYPSVNRAIKHGTNLCPMMRSLIWGPLIVLWHVALVAATVFVVGIEPMLVMGRAATGTFWTALVEFTLLGAAVVGAIWCLVWAARKSADYWHERQLDKPPKDEEPDTGPSFWSLVVAWWDSFHDKICPGITFQGEKAEES